MTLTRGPLRILMVSGGDMGSSASNSAWGLFNGYRNRGHTTWLAVNIKRQTDPDVMAVPNDSRTGLWAPLWTAVGDALQSQETKIPRGVGPLGRLLIEFGHPEHVLNRWQGVEDFEFPGTWRILDLWAHRPDVVHCHTLHGDYFDLRALPWLSSQLPVVLTLHDAWLLSGHCAHSLSCERWKAGCGHCPDLTLYPPVRQDATAYNWQRKREIYRRSRLHIAVPSQWLKKRVEESILMEGAVDVRVISNGIDLTAFRPADKVTTRRRLELPVDAKILLFTAMNVRSNSYKDYPTVRAAGLRIAERLRGERIIVLTLGTTASPEQLGNVEFRFVPWQQDPRVVASYYQASDVYVHAAHTETQCIALMEAMACGRPSVATEVGGIPEVMEDGRTGYLVPHQDSDAMADRVEELLTSPDKLERLGANGIRRASDFDLNREIDQYLQWFEEIAGGD